MSKLFKLKEWLSVPDAAKHLSIVFGENVKEADVLRLALDGHLKLSVNFVNLAKARCGKIVRYDSADLAVAVAAGDFPEDLEWAELPPELAATLPGFPDEAKGKSMIYLLSARIGDDRYVTFSREIITIEGVWDLPMISAERLDVEHKFQSLTGGPAITLQSLEGAVVEGRDGQICQLQESSDNNKYQSGSRAQLEELKQYIADNNIGESEAEVLLSRHKEERKKFLEERMSRPASENYYSAGGLPDDSFLVVRTEALRQFEQSINNESINVEKPMTTTERNSLLTIIAALCDYSAIKYLERGAAIQIARMTEEIGAAVTDETIRKVLGKIPNALETRMK